MLSSLNPTDKWITMSN
jgi:hypothetical protein